MPTKDCTDIYRDLTLLPGDVLEEKAHEWKTKFVVEKVTHETDTSGVFVFKILHLEDGSSPRPTWVASGSIRVPVGCECIASPARAKAQSASESIFRIASEVPSPMGASREPSGYSVASMPAI